MVGIHGRRCWGAAADQSGVQKCQAESFDYTYSIWTVQVIGVFKAKAERVEIPYQTLLNSIVKRYTESMLDIKTI